MSLRTRLTLLFTAIVSILLALFCGLLYGVAEQYRLREFHARLQAEATTAGHLLLGQERISLNLYKLMDRNQLTVLPDEELIIYNAQNRLVYESGTDYLALTPETLTRIRNEGKVVWREATREIVGILFTDQQRPYIIVASAVDTYGVRTVASLAQLLGIGWCVMTGLMLIAGRFFAGRMLKPISQINQRIDTITATSLSSRLPEGSQGDELTQLARRFNRMLNRLEEAFKLQRSFVSHASHELRTPLTAITGQLEVSLLAEDEPDELRATLRSVLDDVRGLNRMTNGLLELAKASMDASAVPMGPVQLDALLTQIQAKIQQLQPDYTIHLRIDPPDTHASDWQLTGSEALLRTAFFNLLDNGGKFSPDHTVWMQLIRQGTELQVTIHNTGVPIAPDQLPTIFSPFLRGRNANGHTGHGLGLALTERIIQLHQGQIRVDSSAEAGTTFTVSLPG
ncbi:sensor histidine kinase [Spirosoma agri]|uniref:histidine kinase n=1 Tax=Spirosoma agri TaxID=1987381 RepID=A0A6M0IHZ7_9BACT|nr:ATP-binding protein [Spirosoma agri]NEU67482.1 HAMP domain-containing protein [Spirosoma agri]